MRVFYFILIAFLYSCTDSVEIETEAQYEEAMSLYQAERYEEALSKLAPVFVQLEGERSELMLKARYLRGFIYYLQDKNKLAYIDYLEGLDIALQLNDNLRVSRLYNEIGQIFFERELFEQALKHFELAFDHSGEATKQDIAYYNFGIGKSLSKLDQLEKAMDYLLVAADKDLEVKNYDALARDYLEMGIVQWRAGNYNQAINHYKKITEIAPLTRKSNLHLWRANNNIGNVYISQQKLEKAEEYLNKSLKYYSSENQLWITYNNLGKVYNAKKEFEKAWNCFKRSLAYNSSKGEMNELITTNHALKKTFEKLNQPDSLLYYTMLINEMALPAMETKGWLKDEEEKIALLTKYQDHLREKSERDQYAKTSWLTAFIMTFLFLSGVLSMRLWKIYNYKSPEKAHMLIKNSSEMVYLLDMFKHEKEEMKKTMDQKFKA